MNKCQQAKNQVLLIGPMLDEAALQRVQEKIIDPKLQVILVDGAVNFFQTPLPKSWRLIGDGDSSRPQYKAEFHKKLNPDKDMSDLAHILRFELPKSLEKLWAEGFSGGRVDHELMNLGELALLLQNSPQLQISWGPQLMGYAAGLHKFSYEGEFSFFSLSETQLSLSGEVKWPISQTLVKTCESLTLSNLAYGTFWLESSAPFFLFYPESNSLRDKEI